MTPREVFLGWRMGLVSTSVMYGAALDIVTEARAMHAARARRRARREARKAEAAKAAG